MVAMAMMLAASALPRQKARSAMPASDLGCPGKKGLSGRRLGEMLAGGDSEEEESLLVVGRPSEGGGEECAVGRVKSRCWARERRWVSPVAQGISSAIVKLTMRREARYDSEQRSQSGLKVRTLYSRYAGDYFGSLICCPKVRRAQDATMRGRCSGLGWLGKRQTFVLSTT
ncbi:hypothetical protein G7046_g9881 [Stylonectria norvegica]|nr:hypothetical protein G7046_g9881 [Stylonectria norvegica]